MIATYYNANLKVLLQMLYQNKTTKRLNIKFRRSYGFSTAI